MTEPLRRAYLRFKVIQMYLRNFLQIIQRATWETMVTIGRRILPAPLKGWIRHLLQSPSFILESNPVQRCRVYTLQRELYAEMPDRVLLTDQDVPANRQPVSLIATVKNEGATIIQWLESIRSQTRKPDEIIIVDGGSTDDTVQKITEFNNKHQLGIRLVLAPGANIATGRNIAIRHASFDIIAVSDAGCELTPEWLHLLTLPFDLHPETEIVAGFYKAKVQSPFERTVSKFVVPEVSDVDPRTFSPSSRSIAFRKSFIEKLGGYPEYLTLAAEDTLLNVKAKKYAREWAFVPDAVVYWQVPGTFRKLFKTFFSWGRGDGEAELYASTYLKLILVYVTILTLGIFAMLTTLYMWPIGSLCIPIPLLLWLFLLRKYKIFSPAHKGWRNRLRAVAVLSVIHLGQIIGYLRGTINRPRVHQRELARINKNFLILAGIPIYDTGGGQRSTQLTFELLRRGFKVTYVNRFPSYESKPLHIRYIDPLLECIRYENFNLRRYIRKHESVLNKTYVIVEFPLREYLKLVHVLRRKGAYIIYDLLDDWNSSLGSNWYSREIEDKLIASSDLLIATSRNLKEALESRAPGRSILLLPNAVNSNLFNFNIQYDRPTDLPYNKPIIGYVGSMYGEWFDEDLVVKVAEAYPEASVVLIGDHRQRFANRPKNLHLLGLKPHHQIPAYLAHFDVCLIPFKPLKLVQATSPLKVFEYLAMAKPVVATKMRELEGLPYVYISQSNEEFIANIDRALQTHPDPAVIKIFVEQNSWKARVDALLSAIEKQKYMSNFNRTTHR